jgi:hypothetical protein
MIGAITTGLVFVSPGAAVLLIFGLIGSVTGFLLGIVAWTGVGARALAAAGASLNFLVLAFWVAAFLVVRD